MITQDLRTFVFLNYVYTHINSRVFPMGVGRNYRKPHATILSYSSRLVHLHASADHTRTSVARTTPMTFVFELICRFWESIKTSNKYLLLYTINVYTIHVWVTFEILKEDGLLSRFAEFQNITYFFSFLQLQLIDVAPFLNVGMFL